MAVLANTGGKIGPPDASATSWRVRLTIKDEEIIGACSIWVEGVLRAKVPPVERPSIVID